MVCHPFCYKPIRTYEDNDYKQSNQRLASQTNTFSKQNLILANLIRFGDTRLKFLFKDFIKTKVNHSLSLKHKLLYKVLIRTSDKTRKKKVKQKSTDIINRLIIKTIIFFVKKC